MGMDVVEDDERYDEKREPEYEDMNMGDAFTIGHVVIPTASKVDKTNQVLLTISACIL